MTKRFVITFVFCGSLLASTAQKSKLNAAWRGLTDYESTLQDKPDVSYLMKAKEAIDLAVANEETKNNPKAYVYKTKIYYELFKYNLKAEEEKAAATISDKNLKRETAYSNVSTNEVLEAIKSVEFLKANSKDQSQFQEVQVTGLSMIDDLNNLAVGRYRSKKYDEAADFFENSFHLSYIVNNGKKDTASLFNASLSAQKAKNYPKVVKLNQRMIDEKMAGANTYQTLYNAKLATQDTTGAIQTLAEGRKSFPNDVSLMNLETDYYLKTGKTEQALENLNKAIEKDPNNPVLHLILGNTYDGMANPKGADGKDAPKPANFNDLFAKAEEHYKKAIDLKSDNKEYYFLALFDLGALYNNYGIYLTNKKSNKTIAELAKGQKEMDAKINEMYKKAIPYFEQALTVKAEDISTLQSLRRLYLLTGQEAKAAEITTKLNKGK
jgi:tetratricopeptide (TPR) repeat protein